MNPGEWSEQRRSELEQMLNVFRGLLEAHWTQELSVETPAERRFLYFLRGVIAGLEMAAAGERER